MNFLSRILVTSHLSQQVKISYRYYPRWSSKSPLKPNVKEEIKDENPTESNQIQKPIEEEMKIKWRYQVDSASVTDEETEIIEREKKSKLNKRQQQIPKTINTTDMFETVINEKGQFIYTKMKNNDARIGSLLATVKSKKITSKSNLVLLEGKRLIKDALIAGCKLKYLIFSRKTDVDYLKGDLPPLGAKIYKMPYKEMQMWSDLTTTPGIMGLFNKPNTENFISSAQVPITIFCDNVREPGNLGAIIRVAASVGCQHVMLSKGCTELWDTKVTRSSAGCHFRVKISTKKTLDDLRNVLTHENSVSQLFIADNKLTNVGNTKDAEVLQDLINQVPIIPYYSVDVKDTNEMGKEIVVIIGGETMGLNADVYQLAKEFNGIRLNIPMTNGVDSLNTGTALGIIIFEFYRQFMTRVKT